MACSAACLACAAPPAGPGQAATGKTGGEQVPARPADGDSAAKPRASGPVVSEAHARQLVTSRLREAGLRVLFDVEVELGGRAITLDGYDPKRSIGFEYNAPAEAASNGAKPAGAADGPTILWLDASDQQALESALDAFVDTHLSPDAGPS